MRMLQRIRPRRIPSCSCLLKTMPGSATVTPNGGGAFVPWPCGSSHQSSPADASRHDSTSGCLLLPDRNGSFRDIPSIEPRLGGAMTFAPAVFLLGLSGAPAFAQSAPAPRDVTLKAADGTTLKGTYYAS